MHNKRNSFSLSFPKSANKIIFDVDVANFDPEDEKPKFKKYSALVDTGATVSCVSSKVASELDLSTVGLIRVSGVNSSPRICPVFLTRIRLPNGIAMDQSVVGAEAEGSDILIGMDLLTRGDFAITHSRTGEIVTSFIYPPIGKEIDFANYAKEQKKKK